MADNNGTADANAGGAGQGAGANNGGSGGGASAGGQGAGAAPTFTLPDAYKDAAYLKDVKSLDDVCKKLAGAQELIGKRPAGIPQDTAPQEEWDKFYASAGRPEKAEAYEFDDSVLGEGNKRDPEVAGKVKGIFHKAGLTSRQAKLLQSEYDKMTGEMYKAQEAAAAADNEKFDTDAKTVFGERKEAALNNAKALMEKHVPESMKARVAELGNKELLVLASVLDGVHSTYIKEDAPNKGEGGGAGATAEDLRKEAEGIMATDAYRQNTHKEFDATRAKVKGLFERIQTLRK